MEASGNPALAGRAGSATQCECCSSQLAKPLRLGKTHRDICDDCLGFMARWWIELGIWEMPEPESPNAKRSATAGADGAENTNNG